MQTYCLKVNQEKNNERLDVYLVGELPNDISRSFVKKLIDNGHVTVNERIAKANYKVHLGDDVHVDVPKTFLTPTYAEPEDIKLDVFYEDDYLLVINKPIGMTVHPAPGNYTGTLVNALLHKKINLSETDDPMRPGIVHRLDKETSGLILVAKDNITHARIAKQFQRHEVRKRYVALVEGYVVLDEGKINVPIGRHKYHREKKEVSFDSNAREAITQYKVLKRSNGVTLISLFPKTGRTHQLRVHMRHINHSILGDDKYGKKSSFTRLALHAQSIGFKHPINNCYVEFSSKVPKSFLDKVNVTG